MWWVMAVALASNEPRIAIEVQGDAGVLHDGEFALPASVEVDGVVGGRSYAVMVNAAFVTDRVHVTSVLLARKGKRGWKKVQQTPLDVGPGAVSTIHHTLKANRHHEEVIWQVNLQWSPILEAEAHDPNPPFEWPDRRFFLTWDDAELRYDPRSAEVDVEALLPEGRIDPARQLSAFRLVGPYRMGRYFEGESVPSILEPHCYIGAPPVRDRPFQYFIDKDDVPMVTHREVEVDFEDGTRVTLASGVAVFPLPNEEGEATGYRVRVQGLWFDVPLPEDAVADWYRPSGHFPMTDHGQEIAPADGVIGRIGSGEVRWEGEGLPLVQARDGVRDPITTVRTPCAEVQMRVNSEAFRSRD